MLAIQSFAKLPWTLVHIKPVPQLRTGGFAGAKFCNKVSSDAVITDFKAKMLTSMAPHFTLL